MLISLLRNVTTNHLFRIFRTPSGNIESCPSMMADVDLNGSISEFRNITKQSTDAVDIIASGIPTIKTTIVKNLCCLKLVRI